MPALRSSKLPDGLEEHGRDHIRCRMCSDQPGATRDVIFLRTSRHGHLASQAHKDSASNSQGASRSCPSSIQPTTKIVPPPPVTLRKSILDYLKEDENEPELASNTPSAHNYISQLVVENGMVFNGLDEIHFSAGDDVMNEQDKHREDLHKTLSNLTWYRQDTDLFNYDPFHTTEEANDERDGFVAALVNDDDDVGGSSESDTDYDDCWAPHGSKTMFMLDLLDHLPRLRLSDDHLRAIIWVMRECGTPNVPTFTALRSLQSKLNSMVPISPEHHTSSLGNHFYMNHPAKLLALDWANPLVRPEMVIYPEISPEKAVSEMWHGKKWTHELKDDELTPMWCDWSNPGSKHFYIQEIMELDDGSYIMPLRWATHNGVVHAESYRLHYSNEEQCFSLADPAKEMIPTTSLSRNILDLQLTGSVQLRFSVSSIQPLSASPNPLRKRANGKAIYRIRVMPWSDDVSGNVSKQYNAHTNVYVQNLSLPHKFLSQEYFVRFSSTSSHASSSEQLSALIKDFQADTWHDAYDCLTGEEILFQLIPHVLPADNPQQSEHTSHIGGNSHLGCRRDLMGGSNEQKETNDGYCALFEPGPDRKSIDTINAIEAQIRLACYGTRDLVDLSATQTGVKDKIARYWIEILLNKAKEQHQTRLIDPSTRSPELNSRLPKERRKALTERIKREIQTELCNWVVTQPSESFGQLSADSPARQTLRPGDHYSPLLSFRGIQPNRDTPIELLHTWLLGNMKYAWHSTNTQWDKKSEELFAIRLQSSDLHGLTTPRPRANYLVQYKNALIGKHFKILAQLAIFHIHGLCSDLLFELWKASGELGAYLWFPEIHDLEQYLRDLQILIDNLLNIWARIDPGKIVVKIKLHLLTHLVDDIRRFGPAILYETEVFECWNAIFRLCSILSNHLSPSKDIAQTLAEMERFKHIISGGWWKSTNGSYTQAGSSVKGMLVENCEVQRRLGWVEEPKTKPGSVKLMPWSKLGSATWEGLGIDLTLLPRSVQPDRLWDHCKHVVSQSNDLCTAASWVFYRVSCEDGEVIHAGRILKIITLQNPMPSPESVRIWVHPYTICNQRHPKLNMPVLTGLLTERHIVRSPDILFPFNAQHDCTSSRCMVTQQGPMMVQERMVTSIQLPAIAHAPLDQYIINMHSLHNPHLLRATLPRELTVPLPYCEDNRKFREEIAAHLRVLGPQKRAETQAKAKATRERNAKKKADAAARANPACGPARASIFAGANLGNDSDDDVSSVSESGGVPQHVI